MLHSLFAPLRAAVARAARRAAFGAAGALFLLVGLGFLTAAAWIALAIAYGGLIAALVMGLIFCGIGFILIAVAARRDIAPPRPSPPPPPAAVSQNQLIDAFLGGLNAGKSMRRK